jgi:anaerobic glycerol-3-phosphate dehydrogenase
MTVIVTDSGEGEGETDASEVAEVVAETASEVAEVVAEAVAATAETADVAIDHETIRLIVRDELRAMGLEARIDNIGNLLATEIVANEVEEAAEVEADIVLEEAVLTDAEATEDLADALEEVVEDETRSGHWLYRDRGHKLFGRKE